MPRKPREKSPEDLYHVVFRGTNKQILFESKYDYLKYQEYISKAKSIIVFEIHAYCLMSNHVHMLVKVPFDKLSNISLRINGPYAHFYNLKYCRTGHLFEIRFGSIPIMNSKQYNNTIRYIHQNPVHAGLININELHKYTWSSYNEFIDNTQLMNQTKDISLCDSLIVLENFKDEIHNDLFEFHLDISNDSAYENNFNRLTDQEAIDIIVNKLGHKSEFIKNVQKMDINSRTDFIVELKRLKLSVKQISRLTGIGRNIIQRANVKL